MEEKKEKKKLNKKPLLICLAIALVFAIVGFIDIKSNAAENENITFYTTAYNSKNNDSTLKPTSKYKYVVYGKDDMEVYYIQSHTEETSTEVTFAQAYVVSKYPMTYDIYTIGTNDSNMGQEYFNSSYPSVEYNINGQTFYVRQVAYMISNAGNGSWSGYVELEFDTTFPKTQISRWYEPDEFAQAYANDYLDKVIDYNDFQISDDIGVVNNLKMNKLNDSKFLNNQIIYDYLTWSNTEKLELQVQFQPVVKIYNNSSYEMYLREYAGDWCDSQILAIDTYNFLCGMDVMGTTVNKDDVVNPETWEFFSNIYGNGDFYDWSGFDAEFPEFCYRYRIRYVDKNTLKAGRWMYVSPTMLYEQYESYIEEIDNSQSVIDGSLDGTKVDIGDIGLDAGIDSVENENAFKDKYGVVTDGIDTKQATNWLNTVVNFIKGTPGVIGSVLGFLPQPILYGMYVCIFLGVIASGVAIVKALI